MCDGDYTKNILHKTKQLCNMQLYERTCTTIFLRTLISLPTCGKSKICNKLKRRCAVEEDVMGIWSLETKLEVFITAFRRCRCLPSIFPCKCSFRLWRRCDLVCLLTPVSKPDLIIFCQTWLQIFRYNSFIAILVCKNFVQYVQALGKRTIMLHIWSIF